MKNNKKLLKIVQAWILVVMALTVTPCSYAAVSPVTQALHDERAVLEDWSVALGHVKSDIEKAIRIADFKAKQIHQELGELDNAIGRDRALAGILGAATGLYKEARDKGNLTTNDGSGKTHEQMIETLRDNHVAIQVSIAAPATLIPASVTKLRQVKTVKAYADTCLRELKDLRVAVEGRKALIQGLTPLQQAQEILRPIQEHLEDGKVIDKSLSVIDGSDSAAEVIAQIKLLPSYIKGADGRGVKQKIADYEVLLAGYERDRKSYQGVVNAVIGGSDAQLNTATFAGATLVEKARDLKDKVDTLFDNVRKLRSMQVGALKGAITDLDPAYAALEAAQALVADGGQADTRLREMVAFNADARHTDDTHKITGIDLAAVQTERQRLRDAITAKLAEAQNVETQVDAQMVARDAQDLHRQAQALDGEVAAAHALLAGKRAALVAAVAGAADLPKITEAQAVLTADVRDLLVDGRGLAAKLRAVNDGVFAAETGYTACTDALALKKYLGCWLRIGMVMKQSAQL